MIRHPRQFKFEELTLKKRKKNKRSLLWRLVIARGCQLLIQSQRTWRRCQQGLIRASKTSLEINWHSQTNPQQSAIILAISQAVWSIITIDRFWMRAKTPQQWHQWVHLSRCKDNLNRIRISNQDILPIRMKVQIHWSIRSSNLSTVKILMHPNSRVSHQRQAIRSLRIIPKTSKSAVTPSIKPMIRNEGRWRIVEQTHASQFKNTYQSWDTGVCSRWLNSTPRATKKRN